MLTTAVLAAGSAAHGYAPGAWDAGTQAHPLIVTQAPLAVGPLIAGGSGQMVGFTVTNEGREAVDLNRVIASVSIDGSTWDAIPGCSAADFRVATAVIASGRLAGGATRQGTVTIRMAHSDRDQDACRVVQVPLVFTAN